MCMCQKQRFSISLLIVLTAVCQFLAGPTFAGDDQAPRKLIKLSTCSELMEAKPTEVIRIGFPDLTLVPISSNSAYVLTTYSTILRLGGGTFPFEKLISIN